MPSITPTSNVAGLKPRRIAMLGNPLRLLTVALVTTGMLATAAVLAAPSQAHPSPTPDSTVVTEWNTIAGRTIFAENATPIPVSGLYFGFVSIAVHDAVVAIEGGFEPYAYRPRHQARGSSEVAAATAAYRVLRHYFPASAEHLDADYAAALADVPDGRENRQGRQVGRAAARTIIRLRQDDGRGAPITLNVAPAPGVWRPTPDAFAPMLAPWLGFVEPLALRSPTQIALSGPDDIGSAAYAKDFAEVKAFGVKEGSSRSAAQTELAMFFSDNVMQQFQSGLRAQVSRRGLDIAESARAFALLGTAAADAPIACWRAKYDEAYWRPITAIRLADTDGNDATQPDTGWTPLVVNPPYPDYTSGHACLTGAASGVFSHLFGADSLGLDLFSAVTSTTRHYDSVADLDRDTMNARIWLGLHFRKAMTDGNRLGHDVADVVTTHFFQPTG
jgi:hypothetical protein